VLDVTIQLAAFGPIALAIMGVVVSISPRATSGRAHWIWAGTQALTHHPAVAEDTIAP